MSMILSQPALDACAHAKSMIDAVTGHQPSPLDGEYSSETLATPRVKAVRQHNQYNILPFRWMTRDMPFPMRILD